MSNKKKNATPYHAKTTRKGRSTKAAVPKPEVTAPVDDDLSMKPVAEVVADPDRVPLSKVMKRPTKPKGGKKPAAAKPAKAPKGPVEPKAKKLSGLDAAAQVLTNAKEPMNAKDIVKAMADQGLWTSPGGKTPHATLHAALTREINGKDSRFTKAGRGLFAAAKGS